MQKDLVEVAIRGVMPTANGCAVFLGDEEKIFVIYVDHFVGNALQLARQGVKPERPLTHDLLGLVFQGFGIELDRVVINAMNEGTFFARVLLRMGNELGKKIVELDARPSDSMVLAVQQGRPLFASRTVYDGVEDMSEVLERVLRQQAEEADDDDKS